MKTLSGRQEVASFFEQLDKCMAFILANLLWCILAIPIITLPAATAGMFAVMLRTQDEFFATVFGAMRRHWMKATVIGLIDLAVVTLLIINLSVFPLMSDADILAFLSRSVTLFAALSLGMVNIYIWPLLVLVNLPLKQLILESCKLALMHPAWSLGVLVCATLPIIISLLLPQAIFLVATFASSALIVSKGARHIIRHNISIETVEFQ